MHIKEVIVVEGKRDTINILRAVDAHTIETQGTHLSKKTLKMISEANKKCGVIIFTDPDFPGTQIRTKINEAIPGCKNAFLPKHLALGKNKVGVEHAEVKDIKDALEHCITYEDKILSISWKEFLSLGLNGRENSSSLRKRVMHHYFLGEGNAKTCFKRLNMLQITKMDIENYLREEYE